MDWPSRDSLAPNTPLPPIPTSDSPFPPPQGSPSQEPPTGQEGTVSLTVAPGRIAAEAQTAPTEQSQTVAMEAVPQPAASESGLGSGRNFESEFAELATECGGPEDEHQNHVHFVLAAEFNIDKGATLAHQYPFPTGTNEQLLAELMLPDGAHQRPEDWTTFYLGQYVESAIQPVLSHQAMPAHPSSAAGPSQSQAGPSDRPGSTTSAHTSSSTRGPVVPAPVVGLPGGELLYCLNICRMKEDASVRRGAIVKGMAICSPNPWIQIYKPMLILALEELFAGGGVDVLERLYDSLNSISIVGMPQFSPLERILLRQSDRKDIFAERFHRDPADDPQEHLDDDITGLSSSTGMPGSVQNQTGSSSAIVSKKKPPPRDTHFFETEGRFQNITLPFKIPMTAFVEDIGDYSMVDFVNKFSQSYSFPSPYIPYLHTNGAQTHPIILIINAILAEKRVIFLGTNMPATECSRMALAACAAASGCGQILRGVSAHSHPYANLMSLDILEHRSTWVVGTTNPRFSMLSQHWDVMCELDTGRVIISDRYQETRIPGLPHLTAPTSNPPSTKSECVDNIFMEDVMAAASSHYGETHVRQRFIDYIARFARLAAHHEYTQMGETKIGYPSKAYTEGRLGSGAVFADETHKTREMACNTARIDVWRHTRGYKLAVEDWAKYIRDRPIKFDVQHQIARLRLGKNMSDSEAEAIFSSLSESVRSYEQVVELLTHLPPHWGGLMTIGHGLLHRWPGVREAAVDLFLDLQHYLVGQQAVANMNYFHRKTFLHLLEKRELAIALAQEQERGRLERYSPAPEMYDGSPSTVNGNDGNYMSQGVRA